MTPNLVRTCGAALTCLAVAATPASADRPHRRLSVTANAIYLLVPLFEVEAELAVHDRAGIALRGGGGTIDIGLGDDRLAVMELGAQGAFYLTGNFDRGVQLGVDARLVRHEGDGMLAGLGDGVAVGPFAGYKRVFGPGVTLEAQLGVQVATGEFDARVLPLLMLSAGWSFLPTGATTPAPAESPPGGPGAPPLAAADPLDHHRGLLFGFSLGGGSVIASGCDQCDLRPGLAVSGSIGWFVKRRWALALDTSAATTVGTSGLFALGVGQQSLAVQWWPHRRVWVKGGVGLATLLSATFAVAGTSTGGGMTLAGGYEFHQDRGFAMDAQLRVTHGSFGGDDQLGVDAVVGTVGVNWY